MQSIETALHSIVSGSPRINSVAQNLSRDADSRLWTILERAIIYNRL